MTVYDVIKDTQELYQEWLEMSEDPEALLSGILATKIIKLSEENEYLRKRVGYVCSS